MCPGFLLIMLALISGCAASMNRTSPKSDSARETGQTFVYECLNRDSVTVRIEGDIAWLFLPNETLRLAHVPSASGARFSDGDATYWSKGEGVLIEVGKVRYQGCKNNRSKAIWEDAKLRGVDFRAVGNEPGWHMEISEGLKIVLIDNYGENQYRFTVPEQNSDPDLRTTIYTADHDGQEFKITIRGERCLDTMSGKSFEAAVTVEFGQRRLDGCGRALY